MEKINSFSEALYHLKDRRLLTSDKKDVFVWKKEKIYRYFSGSCVAMSIEDFADLYSEETFYLFEDSNVFIDEEKDEDYYRYYRK